MPIVKHVGRTIGQYKLAQMVGEGGMGAVYVGENEALGRRVAVKILHPEFAAQPAIVQRFFNEARAANLIRHPSIVDIHEFGEAPEVGAYIIMEYLDGEALSTRLQRQGRLEPYVAVRIVQRIASALGAAHTRGIVHRDLKPDNVYLMADPDHPTEERVKILDFGIAKLIEDEGKRGARTRTGAVLGTPLYMSPEQADGARSVDFRTDIYALGVVAFEMLTGRPPFVADGYGHVLAMHLMQAPPPPRSLVPDLPILVEAAVLRALLKEPASRFASMEEMSQAFGASLGDLRQTSPVSMARMPAAALRTPAPVSIDGETMPGALALAMTTPTPPPDVMRAGGASALGPLAVSVPAIAPAPRRPSTLAASAAELDVRPPAASRRIVSVAAVALLAVVAAGGGFWFFGTDTSDGDTEDADGNDDARGRMKTAASADSDPPGRMKTALPPAAANTTTAGAAPGKAKMRVPMTAKPATTSGAPKPATVTIEILSTPPGAEVVVAGTIKPIGTTPMTLVRERGPGELDVLLRLGGHRAAGMRLSLAEDGRREVALLPLLPARPKTAPGKKPEVKSGEPLPVIE